MYYVLKRIIHNQDMQSIKVFLNAVNDYLMEDQFNEIHGRSLTSPWLPDMNFEQFFSLGY